MTTQNFSIVDLAMSLIVRLDRKNIFPPMLNNPETFLSPTDNLTNLSFRRPKRSPNAFLVCRRNVHEEATRKGTFNMRVISKVTGILWKHASAEEKDVYKKLADRVYEIHYRRTSSIYKKMTASSLRERTTYKPYYSFPIQLSSSSTLSTELAAPQNVPDVPLETPPTSPVSLSLAPVSSVPALYPPSFNSPTFNFDLEDNEYFINNQTSNGSQIDLNTYTDFNSINNINSMNNDQIIPHPNYQSNEQEQQLIYLYNNILVSSPNFC